MRSRELWPLVEGQPSIEVPSTFTFNQFSIHNLSDRLSNTLEARRHSSMLPSPPEKRAKKGEENGQFSNFSRLWPRYEIFPMCQVVRSLYLLEFWVLIN